MKLMKWIMKDSFFNNKNILITGGTGSFGHMFTDYILKNYTKVKLPLKINGEMQHGWNPDNGIPGHISLHNNQSKKKRYY